MVSQDNIAYNTHSQADTLHGGIGRIRAIETIEDVNELELYRLVSNPIGLRDEPPQVCALELFGPEQHFVDCICLDIGSEQVVEVHDDHKSSSSHATEAEGPIALSSSNNKDAHNDDNDNNDDTNSHLVDIASGDLSDHED